MPQNPTGKPRRRRWPYFTGIPVLIVLGIVALWRWDWLIPLVEARAAAALGRPVTLAHLHVRLGRVTEMTADDVRVQNPPDFPEAPPLAQIAHLTVQLDVMRYLRERIFAIPLIDVDQPRIAAMATADGTNNYSFAFATPAPATGDPAPAPARSVPEIRNLTIENGHAHVVMPKQKADFVLEIATGHDGGPDGAPQLLVDAKGSYAGQPVTGKLVSGAVLALQDTAQPYPIELHVANGATQVALTGTVQDPLHFAGADLKLSLAGASMADLYPLTGIPIPKTPGYKVTGQLAYADGKLTMTDMQGVVGDSDLEGSIAVDPRKEREDVTADLRSRQVNLADLGGFIGSEPGRAGGANQTQQQRQAVARAEASPKLLPDTPINLPKLQGTDIHLKYRGAHIQGRSIPFDTLAVDMDVVNGRVTLHPVSLGVGTGQIAGTIDLDPVSAQDFHTKAEIKFDRLDVARLMAATHLFDGAGRLSGQATLDTTGNSISSMLAHGNGGIDLFMSGGNLSALLVDLSGLEFGKAIISALGLPDRADVECLIGQFSLQRGVLTTRTLLLDTSEAVISGAGTVDLGGEKVDYMLKTESKHFSIGSLPAPIGIAGPFKNPSIGPDIGSLATRGGAAVGLGFLAPPLALLPTIQFGVGDDDRCKSLLTRARR